MLFCLSAIQASPESCPGGFLNSLRISTYGEKTPGHLPFEFVVDVEGHPAFREEHLNPR